MNFATARIGNHVTCSIQGFGICLGFVVMLNYVLDYSFYSLLAIVFPTTFENIVIRYFEYPTHLIKIGASFYIAAVPLFRQQQEGEGYDAYYTYPACASSVDFRIDTYDSFQRSSVISHCCW